MLTACDKDLGIHELNPDNKRDKTYRIKTNNQEELIRKSQSKAASKEHFLQDEKENHKLIEMESPLTVKRLFTNRNPKEASLECWTLRDGEYRPC